MTEFFETTNHGGVVLMDGSRLTADVVVAADGVGSKSRLLVDPSNKDAPISSSFIVYRVAFPVKPAMEANPLIAKHFAGHKHRSYLYIDPGVHVVLSKSGDDVCWLLTCKVKPLLTQSSCPFFIVLTH